MMGLFTVRKLIKKPGKKRYVSFQVFDIQTS